MRIVQIEDFFHPDAGYHINIISKYWAKEGHEVYIIASNIEKMPKMLTDFFGKENIEEKDHKFFLENGVKVIRTPIHRYISGRSIYKREIFKLVEKLEPDVLYVHGNDTLIGIQYAMRKKKLKYPLILDNHMLDMASQNKFNKLFYCFYKVFITPILLKYEIPVLRMVEDDFILRRYNYPLENSTVVGFGSDLEKFHLNSKIKEEMRVKLNIPMDAFVGIYAGKLDKAKGGVFLAQALKEKYNTSKNMVFLIIGNAIREDSLEIEELFKCSENAIIRIETQKYNDLSNYYQAADFSIFPKQCSLSFYDVQACGLPVILENNSINKERVKYNNGICFDSNDIQSLREKIKYYAELNSEKYLSMQEDSIKFIAENFNYEKVMDKYNLVLKKIMKNKI